MNIGSQLEAFCNELKCQFKLSTTCPDNHGRKGLIGLTENWFTGKEWAIVNGNQAESLQDNVNYTDRE